MDLTSLLTIRSQESYPLIQVILGPRQVGKTTAAKSLFDTWSASKVMVSADSPVNQGIDFIESSWLRARALPEPCLLIIDEVQKIQNWSSKIKELFDQDRGKRDIRVLLLGSASLSVQTGLTESLAGRFEVIRAPHWSYSRMKQVFGWEVDQYLKFGGYPGAARYIDDPKRWQSYILDSIIEPVLSRDLGLITTISKPALFRQVFALAMEYPAQEVSYQKIVGQLQERGSPQTIKHYLEVLEGGFLLKQIFRYSKRPLTTRTSSPKIIPLAPALIGAFSAPERLDADPSWRGRVFEAAVATHLIAKGYELSFWRDGDMEVDFIAKSQSELLAVEVKSGRPRKTSGMNAFLKLFPKAVPEIVTIEDYMSLED